MAIVGLVRPRDQHLSALNIELADIKQTLELLVMIDQSTPARKRRVWRNSIVMLHGYLHRSVVIAEQVLAQLQADLRSSQPPV